MKVNKMQKFFIPKQTDSILFPFLIFPGKSFISCYGISVLNVNNERENNPLLSLLFEDYQNCIQMRSSQHQYLTGISRKRARITKMNF